MESVAQLRIPQIRLAEFRREDEVRVELNQGLRHRRGPLCKTPTAYRVMMNRNPRVRREARRPWAVECNRFAVKSSGFSAPHNRELKSLEDVAHN